MYTVELSYYDGQENLVVNGEVVSNEADLRPFKVLYANAHGRTLVGGLGLGLGILWLCSLPQVETVTVIEIRQEVIDLFLDRNSKPDKLIIMMGDFFEKDTGGFDTIISDVA